MTLKGNILSSQENERKEQWDMYNILTCYSSSRKLDCKLKQKVARLLK